MRHGRLITTALVAIAAMAIGPAWAAAAPSPVTDDAITDFAAPGTQATDTWAVEPGVVRLKPTPGSENFDGAGPTLPVGWTPSPWAAGGTGTLTGTGSVTVDGAHVDDANAAPTYAPTPTQPLTLEFRATFAGIVYQNVGFGDTFASADGPWATFSTGSSALPLGLYARTMTPGGAASDIAVPATVDPLVAHTYRIEWSTTNVKFYVDDVLVTTPAAVIPGPMRPVLSDLDVGGPVVKADWLAMGSFPSTGSFVSHVLAADDAHTLWGAVKETGLGSGATFETRSGKNATFDSTWSGWEHVGSAGAIQSPSGRQYIQYKATLSSATATLDKVAIDYTTDNTLPSAAINSVDVGGTSASVSFSSPDSDIAGFECSLDGGAFAACASPNALTGLAAGSHTASVQAIDKAANVGTPVSRTFSIASPPSSGGSAATQQPSDGSSAVDTNAPKVSVVAKSLRASKKSTVSFRVGCPATETSCKVTLKLKNGSSSAASKTVTVKGSKTVTITLTLNKATRQLLKHGSLKVSAVYTATDAAGNHTTTTKRMTLSKAAA